MAPRYEIRVRDRCAGTARDMFPDVAATTDGDVVLLSGEFDQSALHGLLERIRLLRLELIDVRRTRSSPGRAARVVPPSAGARYTAPFSCRKERQ